MTERKWPAVAPVAFTAAGTAQGKITISSVTGFKVKMKVTLQHSSLGKLDLEVKRVPSPTTLILGPLESGIEATSDLSMWDNTSFIFSLEQPRPKINPADIDRATYEEEPTVARRVVLVDEFGRKYNMGNPVPTTATITGDINIENLDVNLDGTGAGGDTVGVVGVTGNRLIVNSDGTMSVKDAGLATTLSSVLTLLSSGVLKVDDDQTQALLTTIGQALSDIFTHLTSGTTKVDDDQSQAKLDSLITLITATNAALVAGTLQVGTENGQVGGTKRVFVNNIKNQILAAHDRQQTLVYADAGTKDERVIRIDYTSPTIGSGAGFTARKAINYTLAGNKYIVSAIAWSLV